MTQPGDPDPTQASEASLETGPDGLATSEAQRRLLKYGYNELPDAPRNPLLEFLSHFWGPIAWMIEAAAVLSALVGHWSDFAIIALLLVANATVAFWEEHQAGNTIDALRQNLALKARVRRDGSWSMLPARELVPGDLVRLRLGEIVPADTRLLEGADLEVDQSALTGESLPVTRGPGESVYSSSVVKRGESEGVVTATGRATFFGKTAQLVEEARTVSHFQRAVLQIGNYLIVIALMLVTLIVAVGLLRHDPTLTLLQFALVLTVAAIPVAMPTVLSVTMAVGARLLARQQAIVSRLAAIEELAGVDVLCSDKTGTLTQNRLSLGEPFCLPGVDPVELIRCAALASREEDQDPIDLAVLAGVRDPRTVAGYAVRRFHPFDPVGKRTEAEVEAPDGSLLQVTKGAPQIILRLVSAPEQVSGPVQSAIEDQAARGFRSLGVASQRPGQGWRYLGVLPLHDPPREDSRAMLEAAQRMGITVKMVTGDQVAIAREIASELALGTDILEASALDAGDSDLDGVADLVDRANGFAEVFPEHKFRIVEALQHKGHIVAMTGDGVNDAPALKKADAGVAVSGATDAARSAAAIVLLTPGLSVIVDAIRESRRIFRRMNSYATYRIAETVRVLFFMTLSILAFNFYPVTAIMIVLLALLNDGAILSIAYDRAKPSDKPEGWDMARVLGVATALGIVGVIASFGMFYLGERVLGLDRDTIQSLIYLKLSVAGHLTIFLTRTQGHFWSDRPSWILLCAVFGTQALATLIAATGIFMAPIGFGLALLVWSYALAWFLVNDWIKLLALRLIAASRKPTATMGPKTGPGRTGERHVGGHRE
jgi:H+-transporting ATPase